ncbi:hypothetical protein TorRG33x02_284670 [Trema orientale]|uniref:Uncharacterized protein n=1 Tax=Trema orientale TaxID=63057 RepID=A0A2P5CHH6_TREOI|nr:hypothetical protein TorRG33x02_284670 [Trema orientale]
MAPHETVYFHKLTVVNTDQGQKKERFHMTFSINGAPICGKAFKQIEITKTYRTSEALKGKAAKGLKKRQARSNKRRATKAGAAVTQLLPKAKKVMRTIPSKVTEIAPTKIAKIEGQCLNQIMIGSIPIYLPTVETAMVTFIEEDNTTSVEGTEIVTSLTNITEDDSVVSMEKMVTPSDE